jgi:ABC-2 type transport system ATP-binding protein
MILELNDIYKQFRRRPVLDHINWTIETPTTIALVAPNGTGKSTLLNVITNLETKDGGTVSILGRPNTDPSIYADMTFMQDSAVLFPEMTGMAHMQLIAQRYHVTKVRLADVIERTGIGNFLNKSVGNYSMGMKQLLLFAMAIMPEPKLMFLDEPLNGLDPKAIVMLRETLQEMGAAGTTILFSSHNLDEIDRLTDNVVFLHQGQLIPASTDAVQRYEIVMDSAASVLKQTPWQSHIETILSPDKVAISATPEQIKKLQAKYRVFDVVLTHHSTEHQYFQLFGENQIH